METNELDSTMAYLDHIRFNYVDYLKDAKAGILFTSHKTSKWLLRYDACSMNAAVKEAINNDDASTTVADSSSSHETTNSDKNPNSSSSKSENSSSPLQMNGQQQHQQLQHQHSHHLQSHLSVDLDADVEEFFFNLNLTSAANAFNEVWHFKTIFINRIR